MKNSFILILSLLLSTSLFSCSDAVRDFKYMGKLREALDKKYPNQKIELNITNGKALSVSFVNTSYNDSSDSIKRKIACQIGALIENSSEEHPNFESGEVIFTNKHNYVIASSSKSETFAICFHDCAECEGIK
ncbi:MAG: hypothetical protein HYZ54_03945 [Ignavibacteriae bacterium]|nr:hypothetical protein [Ignavibacteriota bacterium]